MDDLREARMQEAADQIAAHFDKLGFSDFNVAVTSLGEYITADISVEDVEFWLDTRE